VSAFLASNACKVISCWEGSNLVNYLVRPLRHITRLALLRGKNYKCPTPVNMNPTGLRTKINHVQQAALSDSTGDVSLQSGNISSLGFISVCRSRRINNHPRPPADLARTRTQDKIYKPEAGIPTPIQARNQNKTTTTTSCPCDTW
jgi:hypothetical protein